MVMCVCVSKISVRFGLVLHCSPNLRGEAEQNHRDLCVREFAFKSNHICDQKIHVQRLAIK